MIRVLICIAVSFALQGCISIVNYHSGAVGRVIDARTGQPIAHAQVIAGDAHDAKVWYTRADGTFTVPQRSSLTVVLLAPASAEGNLFVSAPGYATAHRKLAPIPPTSSAPPDDLGVTRLTRVAR